MSPPSTRFRISADGVNSAYGFAADGEVEDHTVLVASPANGTTELLADPLFPGRSILVSVGSAANDTIVVSPTTNGNLKVKIDAQQTALLPQSQVDRIGVVGLNGADTIVVDSTLPKAAELYGGAGHDDVFGGAAGDYIRGGAGNDDLYGHVGNDMLFGEEGNDRLFGGHNNDLLLGGIGNDRLHGNGGVDTMLAGAGNDYLYGDYHGDLLVGNSSTYDQDELGAESIHDLWTSSISTSQKVTALRGSSFGLRLGSNIDDDLLKDHFFGGPGQDMFADIGSDDRVNDFDSSDFVFRA